MPTREEMQALGQEIIRRHEDRVDAVAQLGRAEAQREREAQQEIAQRRSDVNAQLTGYDEAHATMSRQLRADLAQVTPALHQAEAQREREAQQEIAQRRSDVSTQLSGYRYEQAGARAAWQEMATTMQAKRGGGVAVAEAPAPVVEEVAPAASVEEATEEESKEEDLGNGGLIDQVFAHLADRPDGARLTELEEEFGASRFEMARVIRRLTDEGKVEKRDMLYFAI